jgi:hypothetical protein
MIADCRILPLPLGESLGEGVGNETKKPRGGLNKSAGQ